MPKSMGTNMHFFFPQALKDRVVPHVRALVILPVRDLAIQVFKVFRQYSEGTSLKVSCTFMQILLYVEYLNHIWKQYGLILGLYGWTNLIWGFRLVLPFVKIHKNTVVLKCCNKLKGLHHYCCFCCYYCFFVGFFFLWGQWHELMTCFKCLIQWASFLLFYQSVKYLNLQYLFPSQVTLLAGKKEFHAEQMKLVRERCERISCFYFVYKNFAIAFRKNMIYAIFHLEFVAFCFWINFVQTFTSLKSIWASCYFRPKSYAELQIIFNKQD